MLLVAAVVKPEYLSECHISAPTATPIHVNFLVLSHPIMSMASTATTLTAYDLTLGHEYKVVNCICILVAIQDDGTPFSHDSFQEEDLVELCIGLAQAHLKVYYGSLRPKWLLHSDLPLK